MTTEPSLDVPTSPVQVAASLGQLADADVRERVSVTGLHETLFVEAGAGTGKTSQLVGRVVNLVLDAGIRLRDIAAITFTEAAATELRDRIRVAFEHEAAASTGHRRDRCLTAIADSDQAAITTLHGFARRMLAEHPLATGLPPDIEIADEIESQLSFERRWERFVDALYADDEHQALLERAALCNVHLEPLYARHVTLRDVAATLTQSWDRLDAVAGRTVTPLGPLDFSPFDDIVTALAADCDTCTDDTDQLHQYVVDLLGELRGVIAIADPGRKLRELPNVEDRCKPGNRGRKDAWDGRAGDVRALVKEVGRVATSVVRDAAKSVLDRLLPLIAHEILDAAHERRRAGRLEFHDLLVLARQLLHASPAARRSLHERYRCLLLDEFQDTDPIQIELAVLIAGAIDGEPPDAWHDVEVGEGRLFFVGDPKQSIYRFRRADIKLFLAARDRFGTEGSLARLSTNFRTVEPVVDWINRTFGVLMADEKPGLQPRYEPLVAHRQPHPDVDHRPILLGGAHTEGLAPQIREAEAADVAAVIGHVRDQPDRWPVLDGEEGGWRPARLADVTILVPTRTSVPYLRAALDERGVPYRLDTGTLVFDTQEVRDVLAAVRAVDDPSDEVSVVAALRSPLYGCSDVDLFTYRQAGGRWDPASPASGELADHPVGVAMRHLHDLWRDRWWLRPADVVERVIRERHAMLAAFGDERPREVWRRLRFLLDQARAFDDAGGGGLREFTEWAELQRSTGSRVHEPLLAETDDDAVRVMTVHGAKGLEFPITILSGMTTKPAGRRRGANVIWDGDIPEIKVGRNVATDNFDPRAEIEDEMDGDEKLRLLYVAATRARDHLVVSCHHRLSTSKSSAGKGDDSYGHQIWEVANTDGHRAAWRHWTEVAAAAELSSASPSDAPAQLQLWDDGDHGDGKDSGDHHEDDEMGRTGHAVDAQTKVATADDTGSAGPGIPPVVHSGPGTGRGGAGATASPDSARAADRDAWLDHRDELLAPARRPRVVSATAVAAAVEPRAGSPEGPGVLGVSDVAGDDTATHEDVLADGTAEADSAGAADDSEAAGPTDIEQPVEDPDRPLTWRRGRAGTAIGRAVHATLQSLHLDTHPDGEIVDRIATREASLEVIPDEAATVAAMVRSALRSDAIGLARSNPHHKELYVAAPVGDRAIEGYVDLLVETPDGLIVIDYKTDAVSTPAEIEAKLARYELQAATYAVALEATLDRHVKECRLVFCRPSGAIERSVSDLDAARGRVRQHLGA